MTGLAALDQLDAVVQAAEFDDDLREQPLDGQDAPIAAHGIVPHATAGVARWTRTDRRARRYPARSSDRVGLLHLRQGLRVSQAARARCDEGGERHGGQACGRGTRVAQDGGDGAASRD